MERYAETRRLVVTDRLGFGWDGIVYATSKPSVVKALKHEELYRRELAVYRHLTDRGVIKVDSFAIPRLIDSDDDALVIEMTFVNPPFVLDFTAAGIGRHVTNWSEAELANIRSEAAEKFGDRWPEVVRLVGRFERELDLFLADLHPGNIAFDDDP